jgi:excisionase family DNA binding protein
VGDDREDWMGTKTAAQYMGVNLRTLYAIIDEGKLPAYKIRRVIRLKLVDVDAYLESCEAQPGSRRHLYPPGEDGDPPKEALALLSVEFLNRSMQQLTRIHQSRRPTAIKGWTNELVGPTWRISSARVQRRTRRAS